MKTFKYFLATLAFVTLLSCSGDDDSPTIDASLVVGEWNLDEYNYTTSTTVSQGGESYTATGIGEATNLDARLIFNNDNTLQTEGSYNIKLSTTAEGETSVSNTPINLDGSANYRIDGNKMTITNAQQTGVEDVGFNEVTIVELTASRMVWSLEETITTEIEGMTLSMAVEAMQVFSR